MTDDLKLRELAERATPGPWVSVDGILAADDEGNSRSFIKPVPNEGWQIAQTCGPNGENNAAFIAAAREAVLALLDRIEALERERDELRMDVIAFAGPWAAEYGKMNGLGKDTLHPQHYDLLEKCGARMVEFTRAASTLKG